MTFKDISALGPHQERPKGAVTESQVTSVRQKALAHPSSSVTGAL